MGVSKFLMYVNAILYRNPRRASVYSSSSFYSSSSCFSSSSYFTAPLRPHFSVSPASLHCVTDFPLGFPPIRNSFALFNLTSPASPDFCVAVRTSLTAHLKLTGVLTSQEHNSEDELSRAAAAGSERRGASPRWAASQADRCPENAQKDFRVVWTMT